MPVSQGFLEKLERLRHLNRLVRHIINLPLELRYMIYEACIQQSHRDGQSIWDPPMPLLWLSKFISKEVLTRPRFDVHFHLNFRCVTGIPSYARFKISQVHSWLKLGLGEITQLRMTGPNIRLKATFDSHRGAQLEYSRPYAASMQVDPLGFPAVVIIPGSSTYIFLQRLKFTLTRSIRQRGGYGMTAPELSILSNALLVVLAGCENALMPVRVLARVLDIRPAETAQAYQSRVEAIRINVNEQYASSVATEGERLIVERREVPVGTRFHFLASSRERLRVL
ncbi:hypothetical protein ANO11243_089270 [Dothideomycetidae sp. 11243]|nr:hypothetical protein ANO11243_089270 [fungal sp. No.11243]